MKRKLLLVIVSLVIFCAGIWLGWLANTYLSQDACLDRGGTWNAAVRTYDLG